MTGAAGVGGHEETGDLDADGEGKEEGSMVMEAVGEGGHQEDGYKVHLVVLLSVESYYGM